MRRFAYHKQIFQLEVDQSLVRKEVVGQVRHRLPAGCKLQALEHGKHMSYYLQLRRVTSKMCLFPKYPLAVPSSPVKKQS